MGNEILQKYKDLYFELGLTERVLDELAEELIEEIDDANPEVILSEKALDIFIKFMIGGKPYYRGLEINKKAGIAHIEKNYPELQKDSSYGNRFYLRTASAEDEHEFDTQHRVYGVNDHFIASDIQKIYVKELIRGMSHEKAIEVLDKKFCISKNLHIKNKLIEAEKTTKATKKSKK